jgi:SecD/SecF fusion protein
MSIANQLGLPLGLGGAQESLLGRPWSNAIVGLWAQATGAAGNAAVPPSEQTTLLRQLTVLAILAAVIVLPYVFGRLLAKWLRMPTYATRIGTALLAVAAPLVILSMGTLKRGVDLQGGTILVYELDSQAVANLTGADGKSNSGRTVSSAELVSALSERINPSGTNEIVVRPIGDTQIEIIVPALETAAVGQIKRKIEQAGVLRFAIVANQRDHADLIERATQAADQGRRGVQIFDDQNKELGFWAAVARETENAQGIRPLREPVFGDFIRNRQTGAMIKNPPTLAGEFAFERWLAEQGINDIEVLMAVDPENLVTGEDLDTVRSQISRDKGGWEVSFDLTGDGASRFYALTSANVPENGFYRRLGIVLDNELLSAPRLESAIADSGRISGNFAKNDVDFLVGILKSGALPGALSREPLSENQIGPTLGIDTLNKGRLSVIASLVTVLLFMLLYYFWFPGFVACLGVAINLLLTLAVMVLLSQPITLPGLAGLVLTVGMSVDANVLIFERIREELAKGTAQRMAIRNGFDRAIQTIVDSNLTTLITGIVLYAIGTDQVRGFAVTLILGILFSMFTAIYVSRTLFDIAERWGWTKLKFYDLFGIVGGRATHGRGFDFAGWQRVAIGISLAAMAIGTIAIIARGSRLLDTDFVGGTTVTFQLQEPANVDEIRSVVDNAINPGNPSRDRVSLTLTRLEFEGVPRNTVFKADTSLDDVALLKQRLRDGLSEVGKSLVTFNVDVRPEPSSKASSRKSRPARATRLVAWQSDEPATPATSDPPATDANSIEGGQPATSEPATTGSPPVTAPDTATAGDPGTAPANSPPVVAIAPANYKIRLSSTGNRSAKLSAAALVDAMLLSAKAANIDLQRGDIDVEPMDEAGLLPIDWSPDSARDFSDWKVALRVPSADAQTIMDGFSQQVSSEPVWLASSKIGSRVAGEMQQRALLALFVSLLAVALYIWFRFQKLAFGVAAVIALFHDVLVTVGAIALSYWLAGALGFLLIDEFKINLSVVAALLTLVGYSLNDTIVIFDRIREVRGKSPVLTADMINRSINQTLSRTILTAFTTFIVVLVLYLFGGAEIHAFAFSLLIGVVVGTYSSVYIASPIVLWLLNRQTKPNASRA